jgi:hypothetical protein
MPILMIKRHFLMAHQSILTLKSGVVLCPNVAELLITGENAGGANRSAKDGGCFVSAGGPEAPESQKGIFAGRPQRSENSKTFGNGIRLALTSGRSLDPFAVRESLRNRDKFAIT